MLKRSLISILVIVALAALGALAAWLTMPRYTPPANGGEARLRERAEQFYRAIQIKDHWTLAQLYTPARQIAEAEELRQKAIDEEALFLRFQEDTREQLRANMDTIHADELTVEIEGDWAVTTGNVTVMQNFGEETLPVEIPIGQLVWVRTGGDWWVYKRVNSELNAYGNPPQFALRVLIKESRSGESAETIELTPTPEMPEETAPDGDGAGGEDLAGAGEAPVEDGEPSADNQGGGSSDE